MGKINPYIAYSEKYGGDSNCDVLEYPDAKVFGPEATIRRVRRVRRVPDVHRFAQGDADPKAFRARLLDAWKADHQLSGFQVHETDFFACFKAAWENNGSGRNGFDVADTLGRDVRFYDITVTYYR